MAPPPDDPGEAEQPPLSHPEPWPIDRVQVGLQSLLLEEAHYTAPHAVLSYASEKLHLTIAVDDGLRAEALTTLKTASHFLSFLHTGLLRSAPVLTPEQVEDHVERLLHSGLFHSSPSIAKLLTHCVERVMAGEQESLKESTIGVLCFNRSPGYDPKLDPIVRVTARRLREKLDLFYQGEGTSEKIRISIPKGTYVPKMDYPVVHPPTENLTVNLESCDELESYSQPQNSQQFPWVNFPLQWALTVLNLGVLLVMLLLGGVIRFHTLDRGNETGANLRAPIAGLVGNGRPSAVDAQETDEMFAKLTLDNGLRSTQKIKKPNFPKRLSQSLYPKSQPAQNDFRQRSSARDNAGSLESPLGEHSSLSEVKIAPFAATSPNHLMQPTIEIARNSVPIRFAEPRL